MTSYQYDNSGRLKLTIHPDGIKTAHALQWAGTLSGKPTNAKFYSYTETSGESPVWVWYDAQGREVRRDAYGLNGNKTFVETGYYARGEVSYITEPYFRNAVKTYTVINTYDAFGRISNVDTPMGISVYTYSGLTVTVSSPADTVSTTDFHNKSLFIYFRFKCKHIEYLFNE